MASFEDETKPALFAFCLKCGADIYFEHTKMCECRVGPRDWLLINTESAPRLPSNILLISTEEPCVVYQEPVISAKKDIYCATPLNRNAIDVEFVNGHVVEFAVSTDLEDVNSDTDCDGILVVKPNGSYAPINTPEGKHIAVYDSQGNQAVLQGEGKTRYTTYKYTYVACSEGELPKSGMKFDEQG